MVKIKIKAAYIVLISIIVLTLLGAVYLTFIYNPQCQNFECFQKAMVKCVKSQYVNEEPEASWGYKVTGTSRGDCVINVKLLMAKQGELGIDRLAGQEMDCYYPKGIGAYPEKDLSKCHGLLKESLQEKIINKFHTIILENLAKFDQSVKSMI